MSNSKRILMISSRPPEHYANYGLTVISGFEKIGWQIDYLTRFQTDDKHVIGIYPKIKEKSSPLKNLLKKYIKGSLLYEIYHRLFAKKNTNNPHYITKDGRTIVSKNEDEPIISINEIVNSITKKYNFVFVHCWQDMLTSRTLEAIYEKLRVPIIITAYDFQPFTGGCFYFGDCVNYRKSCGKCPILNSKNANDQTNINFNTKKNIYKSLPIGVGTSPYCYNMIKQTGMFSEEKVAILYHPMDEKLFRPLNQIDCRNYFNIDDKYRFVILSRFTDLNNKVKGYEYMLDAINNFVNDLSLDQKASVLLLLAGNRDFNYEKRFNIDIKNVGFLNTADLVKAYSVANVFLSSSIDDAGPTMVNQSIMCGTPVISFNIGSAMYLVENAKTGYRVPLLDTKAMAESLFLLFNQNRKQREEMRIMCRKKGLETSSLELYCHSIIKLNNKLLV